MNLIIFDELFLSCEEKEVNSLETLAKTFGLNTTHNINKK
jgi:hypothetical protein